METNGKKWPASTDVCCWWCCHQFPNIPCPLPVAHKNDRVFLVKGCFCSFNCAKAYNFREGGARKDVQNHLLFLMTQRIWYKEHKGIPFPGVIAAPQRTCLKMFGGYMDIDTFRNASKTHVHMVKEPPYSMEVIQQVDCVTAISKRRYKATKVVSKTQGGGRDEASNRSYQEMENRKRTKQEMNLSLKRAKPMVNNTCSLDKFVSVKKK
eukprot:jgi/Mesvir1/18600/Mv17109-RA.1